MITRYWATRFHKTYDIVICEGYEFQDDRYAAHELSGPFNSFQRAKRQLKRWIRDERQSLSFELAKINAMKAHEVVLAKTKNTR